MVVIKGKMWQVMATLKVLSEQYKKYEKNYKYVIKVDGDDVKVKIKGKQ